VIFAKRNIKLKPGKRVLVVPWGDVQSEDQYGRLGDLVLWLRKHRDDGNKVVMFGTGDYFESPAPSDRAAIRAAKNGYGHYEELAKDIENIYVERTRQIAKLFEPIKGCVAGLLTGHHYLDLISACYPRTTDRLLAQLLGTEYWGDGMVRFTLSINGLPFNILAMHGYGSARTAGARLIKRLRMKEVDALCHWYAMGHDNEKVVYPTQVLVGREYFKQYFSGVGSFQRSYLFDNETASYAEKLGLPPSSLGVVICVIQIQKDSEGKRRLDFHVST